jgi:hypothetical protein
MLKLDDFRQLGKVALHREHAIDNDELDSLMRQTLEHALEVFHVVVLVVELLSEGQTTSVNYRCVVAIVADYVIILAEQCGNNALIDAETGREAQTVILANELCYFFF